MLQKRISAVSLTLMLVTLTAAAVLMIDKVRARRQDQLIDEQTECSQRVKTAYSCFYLAMGNPPKGHSVAELLSAAAVEYKKQVGPVPPFSSIYFDDDLSKWRDSNSHKDEIATYAHYQLRDGTNMLFWTTFADEAFNGPDRDVPNTIHARFITVDSAATASTQPAQSAS